MIVETIIVCLTIIVSARIVFRGLRSLAAVLFEGMIRAAFVGNFSRFGDFDDYRIAVIDDTRGYFVRDNALWVVEVEDEELVKSTARPVDLMTVDASLLKEAMAAVDTLHTDFSDREDEST